jgi:hypothetical protein
MAASVVALLGTRLFLLLSLLSEGSAVLSADPSPEMQRWALQGHQDQRSYSLEPAPDYLPNQNLCQMKAQRLSMPEVTGASRSELASQPLSAEGGGQPRRIRAHQQLPYRDEELLPAPEENGFSHVREQLIEDGEYVNGRINDKTAQEAESSGALTANPWRPNGEKELASFLLENGVSSTDPPVDNVWGARNYDFGSSCLGKKLKEIEELLESTDDDSGASFVGDGCSTQNGPIDAEEDEWMPLLRLLHQYEGCSSATTDLPPSEHGHHDFSSLSNREERMEVCQPIQAVEVDKGASLGNQGLQEAAQPPVKNGSGRGSGQKRKRQGVSRHFFCLRCDMFFLVRLQSIAIMEIHILKVACSFDRRSLNSRTTKRSMNYVNIIVRSVADHSQ